MFVFSSDSSKYNSNRDFFTHSFSTKLICFKDSVTLKALGSFGS